MNDKIDVWSGGVTVSQRVANPSGQMMAVRVRFPVAPPNGSFFRLRITETKEYFALRALTERILSIWMLPLERQTGFERRGT